MASSIDGRSLAADGELLGSQVPLEGYWTVLGASETALGRLHGAS